VHIHDIRVPRDIDSSLPFNAYSYISVHLRIRYLSPFLSSSTLRIRIPRCRYPRSLLSDAPSQSDYRSRRDIPPATLAEVTGRRLTRLMLVHLLLDPPPASADRSRVHARDPKMRCSRHSRIHFARNPDILKYRSRRVKFIISLHSCRTTIARRVHYMRYMLRCTEFSSLTLAVLE